MPRVIVIEDDKEVGESFCDYLKIMDIDVLAQGFNGKEAVELYEKYAPDVVLMDVMMPEYDGVYGLQKIREFDPDAKIILVTADLKRETEDKLIELEASAIIYKPYEMEELIETINKVMNGSMELSMSTDN